MSKSDLFFKTLSSSTQKIDAKCLQGYRSAKKKNEDFGKNKSANTSLIDIPSGKQSQQSSTYQNHTSKKDQDHQKVF